MDEPIYCRIVFKFENLKGSIYENVDGLKRAMKDELMRVYDKYCIIANSGITDRLNDEYHSLHKDEICNEENKQYYQYIADGYQRFIVDKFNSENVSPILNFYVDPEELNFVGYLKCDKTITIRFYMKLLE